jgi:hypothetical protein
LRERSLALRWAKGGGSPIADTQQERPAVRTESAGQEATDRHEPLRAAMIRLGNPLTSRTVLLPWSARYPHPALSSSSKTRR